MPSSVPTHAQLDWVSFILTLTSLGQKSFFFQNSIPTYLMMLHLRKYYIHPFTVILSHHCLPTIKQEPMHLKLDFKHLFVEFRGEKNKLGVLPSVVSVWRCNQPWKIVTQLQLIFYFITAANFLLYNCSFFLLYISINY